LFGHGGRWQVAAGQLPLAAMVLLVVLADTLAVSVRRQQFLDAVLSSIHVGAWVGLS
jgi:hypothetical protein